MDAPRIPIQNLYYMLCYAWGYLEQAELVEVSRIESTKLVDLFAHVLCRGVEHIARRGLDQGYVETEAEQVALRGRVDLVGSARKLLLQHGRVLCRFDELSPNTVANRIVRQTLSDLSRCAELDGELRKSARTLLRDLRGVEGIEMNDALFGRVQLHSNNRFYRFLLHVCEVIHGEWLVDPASGRRQFRDFVRDEQRMNRVFQAFLRRFIQKHVGDVAVGAEHIHWKATSDTDPTLELLPRMETDISLRRPGKLTIIDAKYHQSTFQWRSEIPKIQSSSLYQLFSYLSNVERQGTEELEGMLVYPRVDLTVRQTYKIHGVPIHIRTVDLAAPWQEIQQEAFEVFSVH